MLLDNKAGGLYHVVLGQSDNLYDWSTVVKRLTEAMGGDPTVMKYGGEFRMLTEQSQTSDGTAAWRIQPRTYDGLAWVHNRGIQ